MQHLVRLFPFLIAVAAIAGPPLAVLSRNGNLAGPNPRASEATLKARALHRVAVRIPDLHWAAIEGDATEVKRLIAAGADVNATETLWGGEQALHWAAYGGHSGASGATRALIAAGADVNARDDDGETPVREALRPADPSYLALTALLAAGADPEAQSSVGSYALHEAVLIEYENGYLAVALLRIFGADPNSRDSIGATPLHVAALQPYEQFTGGLLLNASIGPHGRAADINAKDSDGRTPLHWVTSKLRSVADRRVVEWLIQNGAEVNATDDWGSTPLDWAAYAGLEELVELLQSLGGVTRRVPLSTP
ncbi:MAG: ankyrin repeat domain-containing protein [Bryobacterales bacterium]|nr:ankyrin repeat domain-containing protein [Bryobacterales bacterium]